MSDEQQTPGSPDWNQMKGKVMAAQGADRMILVAGALFVVDSFLPWYGGLGFNISAWDYGGIAMLSVLFAAGALALALVQLLGKNVKLPFPAGVGYLVLGGGAFAFALLRFLTQTRATKYGLFVAIILGGVLTYAGFMKYKAEQGAAA